jgi:hypothetical protein
MSIVDKIKHQWGYDVGPNPPQVVLMLVGVELQIAFWPDDTPPTIAEIEAVELPDAPDWKSFQTAITTSSAYMRICGHNGQTLAILPTLVYVCSLIESDPSRAAQFAGLWNAIATIAEPTTEEIASLNAIAAASNMPFTLNSLGLIT